MRDACFRGASPVVIDVTTAEEIIDESLGGRRRASGFDRTCVSGRSHRRKRPRVRRCLNEQRPIKPVMARCQRNFRQRLGIFRR